MADVVSEIRISDLKNRKRFEDILEEVLNCEDLNSTCKLLCEYYQNQKIELMSVSFADLKDEKPTIRAFNNLSPVLHQISLELRDNGECPVTKEAKRLRYPFDALKMDKELYPAFLDRRFFRQLEKDDYYKVISIPIVLGRGIANFLVGVKSNPVKSGEIDELVDEICKFSVLMISMFPDVLKLFEGGRLGTLEAECLLLLSNGHTIDETSRVLDLSDMTIKILMKSAARKLGAKTHCNAISRALTAGEISNLKLGRHELM